MAGTMYSASAVSFQRMVEENDTVRTSPTECHVIHLYHAKAWIKDNNILNI